MSFSSALIPHPLSEFPCIAVPRWAEMWMTLSPTSCDMRATKPAEGPSHAALQGFRQVADYHASFPVLDCGMAIEEVPGGGGTRPPR
ncbi:MAG: hypothetical protein QOH05_1622 [Acetobacteraceae bacterium]|nr:hypothetical protein [Acetobacteraceae bacterium]